MAKLEKSLAKILTKKHKTVSVAESCSGGLIANKLTNIPGSSKYFKAGIIAYENRIKIKRLKVSSGLIRKKGAVSKEVAISMAKNIRKIAKTDFGLATTGIAGPSGGSKKKPVGLVYIAASSKTKTICKEFRFKGNRLAIKNKTASSALRLLKSLVQ